MPCIGRVQIRLRLIAIRFRLKQIAFGDGVMRVQILSARVIFVGHSIGVARFQVSRMQQRIIRAAHFESGWPFFTCSPGTTRIRLTGPPTCVITGRCLNAL